MLSESLQGNSCWVEAAVTNKSLVRVNPVATGITQPSHFTTGWVANPWCALYDPVFATVISSYLYVPRMVQPNELFQNQDVRETEILHSLPPQESKDLIPETLGTAYLDIVRQLLTSWDFSTYQGRNLFYHQYSLREHNVYHPNYRGRVMTTAAPTYFGQNHYATVDQAYNFYVGVKVTGLSGSKITSLTHATSIAQSGVTKGRTPEKLSLLNSTIGQQIDTGIANHTDWKRLNSLSYEAIDGLVMSIDYNTTNFIQGSGGTGQPQKRMQIDMDIHYYLVEVPAASSFVPVLNTTYDINSNGRKFEMRYEITATSMKSSLIDGSWTPYVYDALGPNGFFTGTCNIYRRAIYIVPSSSVTNGFSSVRKSTPSGVVTTTPERLINQWSADTWKLLPDVTGLLAISAAEAVEHGTSQLMMNNLENLAQLASLGHMLNPVKTGILLLTSIRKRNWIKAGKDFLDLLSDIWLLLQYGLVPTLRDAKELAENAKPIVQKLRNGGYSTPVTGHGSFTFTVPNDGLYPSFPGMTVTARTKIRFRYGDSSLMINLLGARALGLLPTLGNLWDLIPRSFMVDWFTNIDDKLALADSQLWALALEVVGTTSSLTIEWPIPGTILSANNCRPVVTPKLIRYYRNVSPRVPSYFPTRYDFLPPEGLPDWKTVGALVFKEFS